MESSTVHLNEQNLDTTLASNEVVFIFFYTNWCRFSNMLMPIFDNAADKVAQEFPEAGKVVMGKVDCDKESSIATRFRIGKYPTLKVILNGQPAKPEYRGQRSSEAFVTFIKKQLEDPIKEFHHLQELSDLESNNRIIGYFDRRDQPEYNIFRRVAMTLKDDCQFHVCFGETAQQMHPAGQPVIIFRPDKDRSNDLDKTYTGNLQNFDELHTWVTEECMPLIREITSENAFEFHEEGLPFLILFHSPNDKESIKKYNEIILKELLSEKKRISFVTTDSTKYALPLRILRKKESDLPLIAIDSLTHTYLLPNYKDMEIPGKLKQFVQDFHSGKLHRQFYYGPDSKSNQLNS